MRISIVLAIVLAAGCKDKPSEPAAKPAEPTPTAAPAPTAGTPALAPTPAPAPTPVNETMRCCCVTAADKEGEVWSDAKECAAKQGTCVTPMTQACKDELAMDEAARQRNEADDACPSGDRKDCDGDGFRFSDDKDDLDPKVH